MGEPEAGAEEPGCPLAQQGLVKGDRGSCSRAQEALLPRLLGHGPHPSVRWRHLCSQAPLPVAPRPARVRRLLPPARWPAQLSATRTGAEG